MILKKLIKSDLFFFHFPSQEQQKQKVIPFTNMNMNTHYMCAI